ncbi:hypothetical protein BJV77DRAFT_690969 [Russula vinacea]|nr:hypothetical protein BJV77DRAFT_690969 [Russula vinacea]
MADPAANNNNQNTPAPGRARDDTSAQQDSKNEIWDMYLDEVKEDDKRISDAWKEDSNGILVFTGLFSATVGAFIIEFYKQLSSNSSQTVTFLPNGTFTVTGNPPPLPAHPSSGPMQCG